MPFASTFYDTLPGEGVKETTWAQSAQSRGGALMGVIGADDFALTAHPTTPYAVNIGPGKAFGHGVWDDVTGVTRVDTTAPATGASRWDVIAIRRDWQPTGGGPSSMVAVRGSATLTALPSGLEKRPGIIADQPIWAVQWQGGQTQPRQIIDLRAFVGPGGVEVRHVLARTYLQTPGAAVRMDGRTHFYSPGANNVWDWTTGDTDWRDNALGSTAGVPGVRFAGAWLKVLNSPCQARLVAGGTMLQVRGELNYVNTGTPSYLPAEGWPVARVPAGMYPSEKSFIVGTSDRYKQAQIYTVETNGNILIGPGFKGTIAQFNGVVPL